MLTKTRILMAGVVSVLLCAAVLFALPNTRSILQQWWDGPLKAPRVTGELVVLTLRSPTSTHEAPGAGKDKEDAQTGFEHDLASLFAKELGTAVRFEVMPSHRALIDALRANRGHLAAAGLAASVDLRREFAVGPHYRLIQHQLAFRSAEAKPKSIQSLQGKSVAVIAETPAHDLARDLTGDAPGVRLDVLPHDSHPDLLLHRIDRKESDYALVDSIAFAVSRRFHPDLALALRIGSEMRVAWTFSPAADLDLQQSAQLFFEKIRANGTIAQLLDRYYGHVNRIQPIDSESLMEKAGTLLPKLRPYFLEAQQLTGIDWRTLAAIGYQESHWDASATSPTGVRGLMMLTEDTADRMGVKNRLDAKESIIGGAKYLQLLRETVPARIPEPDRTWLALAAYNQGYGHLEDARILTQKMKLNADSWLDVRKAYARLRDPDVASELKHGSARGDEAVQFVENIRNYTDMLMRLEKPVD